MYLRYTTLLYICLWFLKPLQGQNTQPYAHAQAETWLPKHLIRDIYQDAKGGIWICTNAGLYKYNLHALENINLTKKTTTQFLNNATSTIAEDSFGNILVGTESGLGVLENNGNCTILSKTDETISKIKVETSGVVWWMTLNGKLYKAHPLSKNQYNDAFLVYETSKILGKDTEVNTFDLLPTGEIAIGSNKGFYLYNQKTGSLIPSTITQNITTIFTDKNQNIWVGTSNSGLFLKEENTTSFRKIALTGTNIERNQQIISIKNLAETSLLVTTPQNIYLVSEKDLSVKLLKENIFPNRESYITTAFADRTANIWLGSPIGLYKMKKQGVKATFFPIETKDFFLNNQIHHLYSEGNSLWIGTSSDGLYRMNTATLQQSKADIPLKTIRRIRKSQRGDWIVAGSSKIGIYTEGGGIKMLHETVGTAMDLLEIAEGEWWITTWTSGLTRFFETPADSIKSPHTAIFNKANASFNKNIHPFCLIKDREQNVWIGTRGNGLYKINLPQQTIQHYGGDTKGHIASNRILCLKEDSKGNIWVGTRGDGLLLYQAKADDFKIFDAKNGLMSNTICAIEEGQSGSLWLSTLNGLAKIRDISMPFQTFGSEAGINSPEFHFNASAKDAQGYLYFGNVAGIYRLKDVDNMATAQVPFVWTQFDILNAQNTEGGVKERLVAPNEAGKTVELAHNQNSFRIGFALLDYTTPEKNQYAYRLIGKDTTWQYIEGVRPVVEYVDLATGDYLFEVRSANSYGQWMTATASLKIAINPSFWWSRTAFFFYFLLIGILAITAYILWQNWFKLNRQLQEEHEIAQKQTQQIVFYTDLSHEIKNRLSLILGPLEQALHDKKVNTAVLDNLYDQALRVKKLTDQIMNIRKGESGMFNLSVTEENIKSRLEKLYREAQPLAVLKNIQFDFNSQKETLRGWYDEELVEIIVQNLLNNAIKYCKIGGEVSLKIDAQYLGGMDLPCKTEVGEGNYLICTVQDTGVGIPQAEIDKVVQPFYRAENTKFNREDKSGTGIGLDLVARLINLHHGCLDIRSEEGIFTAVTFYLPIDKLQYNISELKPSIVHAPIVLPDNKPHFEEKEGLILPQNDNNIGDTPPLMSRQGGTVSKPISGQILVVDDNPEILKYLKETLEMDFTVHTADDGQEALAVLKKQDIELIVSDLSMPNMDGLTLCRHIRQDKNWVNLPFVILTGRNSEEQKLVCFQNEVDDFIEKPFSPELLRWRVKSLLRQAKGKQKKVVIIEPREEIYESEDEKFIQNIVNLIDQNIDKAFLDVEFLANNLYFSRATFYRKMEEVVGESPSVFIRKYRLKKAAQMLKSGQFMVHEVASKTGFSNPKYFSKCFEKEFGVLPTQV